ncbi:site-specific integrase [Sphingomonas sp.]|uniref:tyrosine-type recombinase/integrase n=1 Tax=Sphingomonas sp. TaxID=28214 RepID=UPI0025E14F9A|nr:site-specific integrase [Sphingomonas sp.]
MGKLSAAGVKALLEKPGRYSDGDGLILFVRSPGQASWVARVQHNGKRRDYGIGSAKLFKLTEARDRAWEVRRALADGRDPRTLWKQPEALVITFRDAADKFLDHREGKVGGKRLKQGSSQLTAYAFPALGRLQVQSIDADRIADCLRPIWTTKPEVARQVRRLIVDILSYARPDAGHFEATLTKAIGQRLPKQPAKGNFGALPYQDVPAFMERLEPKTGIAALALRLLILCASRSGEIRGATWDEIDLERAVWTIPAERMKMRKPHRVPLSGQALAVLQRAAEVRRTGSKHVFPNGKGVALSDMALTKTLRDMKMDCTAHGFRSSFRDWAAEQTSVAGEIAEAALAHAVSNAVEAAYKRTDFFDRRRELMNAWGRFANGEGSAEVVKLKA